jgi:hypothetical protein
MKAILGCTALALAVAATTVSADAKGCIKGAIVGGVAGHVAGHVARATLRGFSLRPAPMRPAGCAGRLRPCYTGGKRGRPRLHGRIG